MGARMCGKNALYPGDGPVDAARLYMQSVIRLKTRLLQDEVHAKVRSSRSIMFLLPRAAGGSHSPPPPNHSLHVCEHFGTNASPGDVVDRFLSMLTLGDPFHPLPMNLPPQLGEETLDEAGPKGAVESLFRLAVALSILTAVAPKCET